MKSSANRFFFERRYLDSALFCLLMSVPAFSQDSIGIQKRRVVLVFAFDGRYSFIRNQGVNIQGIKAGLEFRSKWRVGLGVYGLLKAEQYTGEVVRKVTGKAVTVPYNARLTFWYGSAYGEYVWLRRQRWEVSFPLNLGIGKTHITAYNSKSGQELKNSQEKTDQTVFLVEPSVTGHYKILNWIGVGGGVGYRWMLFADDRMKSNFNNPIYIIKLKLFLGELIQVVKKKEPLFR
jgi:hypothetical protein